jgi:hypothetical protein
MNQGDVNNSIVHTANGGVVTPYFHTNSPHSRTAEFRLEGTRGVYAGTPHQIYLEGRSPKPDQRELIDHYQQKFDHPFWKELNPEKYRTPEGHFELPSIMMWLRLLRALQHGSEPDMNVCDAVPGASAHAFPNARWLTAALQSIFPISREASGRKLRRCP